MEEERLAVLLSAFSIAAVPVLYGSQSVFAVERRRLLEVMNAIVTVLGLEPVDCDEIVDRLIEENVLVERNGLLTFNEEVLNNNRELLEAFAKAKNIAVGILRKLKIRLSIEPGGTYVAS